MPSVAAPGLLYNAAQLLPFAHVNILKLLFSSHGEDELYPCCCHVHSLCGSAFLEEADKLSPASLLGGGNRHRAFFSITFSPKKLEVESSSKAIKLLIELPFPTHSQGAPSHRKNGMILSKATVDPLFHFCLSISFSSFEKGGSLPSLQCPRPF